MTAETSNARWETYTFDMIEDAWGDAVPLTKPYFDRFRARLETLRQQSAAPPPAAARGGVRGLVAKVRKFADALTQSSSRTAGQPWIEAQVRQGVGHRLNALLDEIAAEGVQAGGVEQRSREADRQRFSDPEFNAWLDTGISDAGHTVWDAVGDTQAAWAGWEARQFAGDAVLISECCGREECGGECGNPWRGMRMCRKPADALSQQPEARGGGEVCTNCKMPKDGRGWLRPVEMCQCATITSPPSAPVGVEGGINVPAAKALIEALAPGFKVIYRSAFRWLDQGGNVLPNHYEMFSAETLARDFGYDLVLDLGYAAILRDPSALAQQPAAVDGALVMVQKHDALILADFAKTHGGAMEQLSARRITTLAAQHQEPAT